MSEGKVLPLIDGDATSPIGEVPRLNMIKNARRRGSLKKRDSMRRHLSMRGLGMKREESRRDKDISQGMSRRGSSRNTISQNIGVLMTFSGKQTANDLENGMLDKMTMGPQQQITPATAGGESSKNLLATTKQVVHKVAPLLTQLSRKEKQDDGNRSFKKVGSVVDRIRRMSSTGSSDKKHKLASFHKGHKNSTHNLLETSTTTRHRK